MRVAEAGNNKGFTFTTGFTICREKHNKSEKQIEKTHLFYSQFFSDHVKKFTLCWIHLRCCYVVANIGVRRCRLTSSAETTTPLEEGGGGGDEMKGGDGGGGGRERGGSEGDEERRWEVCWKMNSLALTWSKLTKRSILQRG
ncbi:hypothetical protein MTR_2g065730 [Medicago truncatula]|uniref:Uncharacterized protein n=1 Tax=Medicago truncatula TaxID=3880 RepID=G7IQV5_MEDTR|nr:hypothetical protein MTR_2g065730 [Medicago truncatula]